MPDLSDHQLLSAVRALDDEAFAELWRRHSPAAVAAARAIAPPSEAEDIVSEAFVRILTAIREGAGPESAFRPYLYQVIRSVVSARYRSAEQPSDALDNLPDPSTTHDPLVKGFNDTAVCAAYLSLPERWREVLWYTEIERLPPREIAPLLGLSAAGVAALAFRAREGLRSAWVEAHASSAPTSGACLKYRPRLQRFQRGKLSPSASRAVQEHLDTCTGCSAVVTEFALLNDKFMLGIAGAMLGAPLAAQLLPLWGESSSVAVAAVAAGSVGQAGSAGSAGSAGGLGTPRGGSSGGSGGSSSGGGLGIAAVSSIAAAGALLVVGAGLGVAAATGAFSSGSEGESSTHSTAAESGPDHESPTPKPEPAATERDKGTDSTDAQSDQTTTTFQAEATGLPANDGTPGTSRTPTPNPTTQNPTPTDPTPPNPPGPSTPGGGIGGGDPDGDATPPPPLPQLVSVSITGDWATNGPLGLSGTGATPLAEIEIRSTSRKLYSLGNGRGKPQQESSLATTRADSSGAWHLDAISGVTPIGVTIEVRQRVGAQASEWFTTQIANAFFEIGVVNSPADDDGSGLGWTISGWPGASWSTIPHHPSDPILSGVIGSDGRARLLAPTSLGIGTHSYQVGYVAFGAIAPSSVQLTITVSAY